MISLKSERPMFLLQSSCRHERSWLMSFHHEWSSTSMKRSAGSGGVSIKSLIYRSRELGKISEVSARRAYQRLNQLRGLGFYPAEPGAGYIGETPRLLTKAFALAEGRGLTLNALAEELSWSLRRLRLLLYGADQRPQLRLGP